MKKRLFSSKNHYFEVENALCTEIEEMEKAQIYHSSIINNKFSNSNALQECAGCS